MSNNGIVKDFDDEKDDRLKFTLSKIDNVEHGIIVILNGYIDNSGYFQRQVEKIISSGFIKIIFDCKCLNYVSSTGIGSFTSALKRVKPKGGDIVLLGIQRKVYEVFQLLGFNQFFNIFDEDEDALDFFNGGAQTIQNVFPKIFACPVCEKKLKVLKAGRYRCSKCKTILVVDDVGNVFLG